jgi:hypothetical protein
MRIEAATRPRWTRAELLGGIAPALRSRASSSCAALAVLAVLAGCSEYSGGDAMEDASPQAPSSQAGIGSQSDPATSAGAGGSPAAGLAGAGAGGASGSSGSAGNAGGSAGNAGGSAGNAPVDAGQPDGSGDGARPAPSGCPDESFCDSFDSTPDLDGARWQIVTPNCSGDGTVAVDSEIAHSGERSLRVSGSAGYCNHVFVQPTALPAPLPDPLYGRVFLRLQAPLGSAHVTFITLRDGVEAKDLRMGGQSEILMWNRESDDATLPELSPTGIAASVRPEAQRWLCVEFMIDAAARTLHTWVDEQPVPGLQIEGEATPDVDAQWLRKPDWMPRLEDAKLGWESYGDGANTLWLDDVALGATRFGCAL